MSNNKTSDRRKYVEYGRNEYSSPKNKPPRYDLRRRHKRVDDADRADRIKEEKEMKLSEEVPSETDIETAKKLARIKLAGRPPKEVNMREGINGFKFKEKGIRSIADTYKNLASAFKHLIKANNIFSSCKSSQISPDGKLGGKGYIISIKEIRNILSQNINALSELLDTFHDEVNSPHWKKTTVEHYPSIKEILSEAEDLIDEAEEAEEHNKEAELTLSDTEKEKIRKMLISKNW